MNTKIGSFEIDTLLGQGGMAQVFKAFKKGPNGFSKAVALKKVLPPYADLDNFNKMLSREACLQAMLAHPNLVQVYDFFIENKEFYLVMELVDGFSLRQIYKQFKQRELTIPWQASIYIIDKILNALDYIQNKKDDQGGKLNIVHRDISPQNILISTLGNVKLSDFGIALSDFHSSIKPNKTKTGMIKGKTPYLSPEQILGQTLQHQSDLFSLAVVCFECVFHQHPFLSNNEFAIMKKIEQGLSEEDIYMYQDQFFESHGNYIPEELCQILYCALHKNTDIRFHSAQNFKQALLDVQESDWLKNGQHKLKQLIAQVQVSDTTLSKGTSVIEKNSSLSDSLNTFNSDIDSIHSANKENTETSKDQIISSTSFKKSQNLKLSDQKVEYLSDETYFSSLKKTSNNATPKKLSAEQIYLSQNKFKKEQAELKHSDTNIKPISENNIFKTLYSKKKSALFFIFFTLTLSTFLFFVLNKNIFSNKKQDTLSQNNLNSTQKNIAYFESVSQDNLKENIDNISNQNTKNLAEKKIENIPSQNLTQLKVSQKNSSYKNSKKITAQTIQTNKKTKATKKTLSKNSAVQFFGPQNSLIYINGKPMLKLPSKSIQLKTGNYFILWKLPSGQKKNKTIQIKSNKDFEFSWDQF